MRHPEDYVEAVLACVEAVPRGRVTTYGAIADAIGRFGPRRVGNVMSTHGGGVPWWRVVRADGSLPDSHLDTLGRRGHPGGLLAATFGSAVTGRRLVSALCDA